eukprot:TRINITY_DN12054_c0_g1_i1.p1 TRINITY_DN12054_c0_g1~~TRINITY_DN12054_c0_g1_i1.p1  ORF type:complete len:440 (-),score=57.13 TRINITY_DN12054_c0_g1_i1:982-2301(-)
MIKSHLSVYITVVMLVLFTSMIFAREPRGRDTKHRVVKYPSNQKHNHTHTHVRTKSQLTKAKSPNNLRVAFYPFIPDITNDGFKNLIDWVTSTFKSETEDSYTVTYEPLSYDDAYDPVRLREILCSDEYDIIEIDSVLLADVVSSGCASPWELDQSDWWPTANEVVLFDNVSWGAPHWLCGYFMYSRDQGIAQSVTISQLINVLSSMNEYKLAVDFEQPFNLPSLYLNSISETYGPDNVPQILLESIIDDHIVTQLKKLFGYCQSGNENPNNICTDLPDSGIISLYTENKVRLLVEYSEKLFEVFTSSPVDKDEILISPPSFGDDRESMMYSDVYLRSSTCAASESCSDASNKFIEFMLSESTMKYIATSQDSNTPNTPYRYTIPATKSAWELEAIKNDKYYQSLKSQLHNTAPFPNIIGYIDKLFYLGDLLYNVIFTH